MSAPTEEARVQARAQASESTANAYQTLIERMRELTPLDAEMPGRLAVIEAAFRKVSAEAQGWASSLDQLKFCLDLTDEIAALKHELVLFGLSAQEVERETAIFKQQQAIERSFGRTLSPDEAFTLREDLTQKFTLMEQLAKTASPFRRRSPA